MATNRLPAASRKRHDNSTINLEIGARSQAACGSTLTLAMGMFVSDGERGVGRSVHGNILLDACEGVGIVAPKDA